MKPFLLENVHSCAAGFSPVFPIAEYFLQFQCLKRFLVGFAALKSSTGFKKLICIVKDCYIVITLTVAHHFSHKFIVKTV